LGVIELGAGFRGCPAAVWDALREGTHVIRACARFQLVDEVICNIQLLLEVLQTRLQLGKRVRAPLHFDSDQ
jgi:hypothetical protein